MCQDQGHLEEGWGDDVTAISRKRGEYTDRVKKDKIMKEVR